MNHQTQTPCTRQRSSKGSIILLLILMGLASFHAAGQTATNACTFNAGSQYAVNNNICHYQTFNVLSSFNASMNPGGCSSGTNTDGWGWFIASGNPTVVTYEPEASVRAIMHAFSGTCGSLTQMGCHISPSPGMVAQLVLNTVAGQQYAIRVQRLTTNGAMNGRICIYNPPANDECAISQELIVMESCNMLTYTTQGAQSSPTLPNPTCGGTINSSTMLDIWFHFYAPPGGKVVIETSAASMTDGVMQLYSGACNALTLVQCDDDSGPGNMPRIDRSCTPLNGGQIYRLRIFGKAGTTGTFNICVYGYEQTNLPQDCSGGSAICHAQTNRNFMGTHGCTQDLATLNRGCLIGNERQGMWYYFAPTVAGTFEFTIRPTDHLGNTTTADIDFAIWDSGMQVTCPPSSAPIRCSYAKPGNSGGNIGAGTVLTGLRQGETDTSEPAYNGVNGFVAPLIVPPNHVGKVYVLYIDNFDMNGGSFQLDWTFVNGGNLGCFVLPVELVSFGAGTEAGRVRLDWTTMSEQASDRFVIERSANGEHFTAIGSLAAAGNSQHQIDYRWHDADPLSTRAYYRLRQVDQDGTEKLSHMVTAEPQGFSGILSVHPNPALEQVIIDLPDLSTGDAKANLYDQSGRLMRQWDVPAGPAREFRIPLHDVERGSYLLQLVGRQGGVSMARFIRQ